VEVEVEPAVEVTVYGGKKRGIIDNGTKKKREAEGKNGVNSRRPLSERNISEGIR